MCEYVGGATEKEAVKKWKLRDRCCTMEETGGDTEFKDNAALRLPQTEPHSTGDF